MSNKAAMRKLCADLVSDLEPNRPADPKQIMAAMCTTLSRHRGRPVEYRFVPFPPDTASGLWLDLEDRDLICLEERTYRPSHWLVIFGHEVWHVVNGHRGTHSTLKADAAHLAPRGMAARTDFDRREEEEAETFGLQLAAALKKFLTPADRSASTDIGRRIETTLGRHTYTNPSSKPNPNANPNPSPNPTQD
ncbi:toxin-antitoxin system, toxin component [Streptomyces sp. NPDC002851]